ncbi:MAG: hypothetical protein K2J46_03545 [Muribaculaceae bacterium]|nr:hypothetical protein [Muribaculaceae bacterium]
MLILEYITELVADALGTANSLVDIPVGITVDPVINRTSGYIYSPNSTVKAPLMLLFKFSRHQLE